MGKRKGNIPTAILMLTVAAMLLTACWDKAELNELAIVSMIADDYDPESGKYITYYHVINPLSSASNQGARGSSQSPIYSYKVESPAFGENRELIYRHLSRKLFIAHYKAVLISERMARHGIRDLLNYIDMQTDARASVPVIIAVSPLEEVMTTFSVMERLPADGLANRLRSMSEESLKSSEFIRAKDITENMLNGNMIVLPVVRVTEENERQTSDERSNDIDATHNNLEVSHGALIKDFRLVGYLNDDETIWYHLLANRLSPFAKKLDIGKTAVTMQFIPVTVNRSVKYENGRAKVHFDVLMRASTVIANEYLPHTTEEIQQTEKALGQALTKEPYRFCEKLQRNNWDLFGIKRAVALSREGKNRPLPDDLFRKADITIDAKVKIRNTGSSIILF